MRLILLGCPGAGKGTQAKLITKEFNIPHISTGDILRAAITQGSPLGEKVKSIVESGNLVPDDIMIELVKERINAPDCKEGFLLDGFPRTAAQAEALNKKASMDYVLDIDVPDDEIVKRLTGRRIHLASGRIYHTLYQPPKIPNTDDVTGEPLVQRSDDTEETVRRRLKIYHEQTGPLKEYYLNLLANKGDYKIHYFKIDGTRPVDEIKDQIFHILSEKGKLNEKLA